MAPFIHPAPRLPTQAGQPAQKGQKEHEMKVRVLNPDSEKTRLKRRILKRIFSGLDCLFHDDIAETEHVLSMALDDARELIKISQQPPPTTTA